MAGVRTEASQSSHDETDDEMDDPRIDAQTMLAEQTGEVVLGPLRRAGVVKTPVVTSAFCRGSPCNSATARHLSVCHASAPGTNAGPVTACCAGDDDGAAPAASAPPVFLLAFSASLASRFNSFLLGASPSFFAAAGGAGGWAAPAPADALGAAPGAT